MCRCVGGGVVPCAEVVKPGPFRPVLLGGTLLERLQQWERLQLHVVFWTCVHTTPADSMSIEGAVAHWLHLLPASALRMAQPRHSCWPAVVSGVL